MRSLNLVFNCSKWGGGGCFVCCRVILRGCVALLPACPVDLRCPGCSVVEYPGKVACPSGRRCSTRNAVWCHSHPGFKSQRYRHCRPAPLGPGGFVIPGWCGRVRVCACCGMLLVAPRVFRAPSGPAAREARRPHFVRRRASKPARALRLLRCPPHRRRLVRINFARNSPMAVSNSEFRSLELQRFGTLLNVHPIELRASFLRSGHIGTCWCRSRSPQTGRAVVGYRHRLCSVVPVWG